MNAMYKAEYDPELALAFRNEIAIALEDPRWRGERDSVSPDDPMLGAGGSPAARRHDPTGHEDCAAEWEPCGCHGDRLCLLGTTLRWMRQTSEHAAWMRGVLETPMGPELLRMAGCDKWEPAIRVRQSERMARHLALDAWPLLVANARAQKERDVRLAEVIATGPMTESELRYVYGDR
jgi:hypothetical protein